MRIFTAAPAALAALLLAGCGSSAPAPTDVALLRQACRTPPSPGIAYDWDYATVDSHGVVTGVARCGSDGGVASWAPRPSGRGDHVRVYAPGVVGP